MGNYIIIYSNCFSDSVLYSSSNILSYLRHYHSLKKIVFRYTIWDYVGEGVYVVTVDLAVCLEDGGDCLINVNILDQAKLSKQICRWGNGFMNPGKYRVFIKNKFHMINVLFSKLKFGIVTCF